MKYSLYPPFKQLSPGKTRAKTKYGVTFHSLNATGTLYGDEMLEQVTEWVLSNEVKESANQIHK